jgi:UDP-glucose 4-epimerase
MSRRPAWWLKFLAVVWPITWTSARMTKIPVLGKLLAVVTTPLFSGKNLNISYIPINKEVKGAESSFLPEKVVEVLIRQSSHRVIINRCTCRDACGCKNHPIEYGCTLLGEGTKEIDPRIARHVSVDEAIEHFHKTLEDGLIPQTGRVRIDNFIWGVKDRGKLLTLCHCCTCCCTILKSGRYWPEKAADSIVKLEGLTVDVIEDKCVQCGKCIDECFMDAIKLTCGRIVHDQEKCKGCGICASVCKEKAISVEIASVESAVNEIYGRIKTFINFE